MKGYIKTIMSGRLDSSVQSTKQKRHRDPRREYPPKKKKNSLTAPVSRQEFAAAFAMADRRATISL